METEENAENRNARVAADAARVLELLSQFKSGMEKQHQELRDASELAVESNAQQVAFFEKLVLLDGGSFALSLTFIGSLSNHIHKPSPPTIALGWMDAAWVFLLASIILSWCHNLRRNGQNIRLRAAVNAEAADMRGAAQSQLATQISSLISGSAVFDGKEINLSQFFKDVGETYNAWRHAQTSAHAGHVEKVSQHGKLAQAFGQSAFLATLIAFALMLVFAIKTCWVLLLPT